MPKAYWVTSYSKIKDPDKLDAYAKLAGPAIAPFGGHWKQGDDVVIVPAVSDEDAKKKYPGGWETPLPYIRMVSQPK